MTSIRIELDLARRMNRVESSNHDRKVIEISSKKNDKNGEGHRYKTTN